MPAYESMPDLRLTAGDALIVVDMQNDFFPGGALPVRNADRIVPAVNSIMRQFAAADLPIAATRDWHPRGHCSFAETGGPWPPHCIQETFGAEFRPDLELPEPTQVISKGTAREREAYSGFSATELRRWLDERQVRRVFICGVATDYCVYETTRDALSAGFEVVLLGDAIKAVNQHDGQRAIRTLLELGALLHQPSAADLTPPQNSPLLTDLYQLTMLQGYFEHHMEGVAVFEFFVRRLPSKRNFLVAAGVEQTLQYLENLRFNAQELRWLASSRHFNPEFIDSLANLRFTGTVHAMPEGTIFFANEPVLRVTAPLPQAQLVESRLINILQFQTLIASKAARSVLVAPDKLLVDFGMRRAHGAEAGLLAARATYLTGFAGTATVQAGQLFDIPLYGTMAHSFIQAHDEESDAFERFSLANPTNVVLLLDTYDTERAAETAVRLAGRLQQRGIRIKGVRLDSGDLAEHAVRVRQILDAGGLEGAAIFASGGLDEIKLKQLVESGAPIDGFGVGTRLDASVDAPYLDCAYKLQEYAGRPRLKRSEGKETWPGRKQVYRSFDARGMTGDVVSLEDDSQPGEPLLQLVMRDGRRTAPPPSLEHIRQTAAANLARLPAPLRQLEPAEPYTVEIAPALRKLADSV